MNTLSDIIKKLRKRNSLSQDELATKLEISRSAVSMYERGEREPDMATINKIANFYDVTVDFLVGNTDMVVCNECGFGRNPLNELAEKEHEEFHDRFLKLKEKYAFLMNYKIANYIKDSCARHINECEMYNSADLTDFFAEFDLYLHAMYSLKLGETSFIEKISYNDFIYDFIYNLTITNKLFSKHLINNIIARYNIDPMDFELSIQHYHSTREKLASFYDSFRTDEIRSIVLFLEDLESIEYSKRVHSFAMLDNYRALNNSFGKPEAEKRIEELTQIPKYCNKAHDDKFIQHIESLRNEPIAAHANEAATPEENKFDDDIMDDDSEW